jgi:hypothetical protein
MAAPTKYASPLDQMIELATEAIRGRDADGRPRTPFDDFWDLAMRPGKTIVMTTTPNPPAGAIRWPTDRNDRVTWQGALEEIREGFQRAYEGTPANVHEQGLAFLAPVLKVVRDAADDVEREREQDELADLMAA